MSVIVSELAGLNARVVELADEVRELRSSFQSNAKRVEDALVWVVAVVKEIREAGVTGLLRGTRRKTAGE